ncbi:MAG: hypothetical protein ABWX92_00675 [Mycetocola sp.]
MTADDTLVTDIDAWELPGPPRRVDGRWQGGIGPGEESGVDRTFGAYRGAQVGLSGFRGYEGDAG